MTIGYLVVVHEQRVVAGGVWRVIFERSARVVILLAVLPDGSAYVADPSDPVVWRLDTLERRTTQSEYGLCGEETRYWFPSLTDAADWASRIAGRSLFALADSPKP